MSATSEMDRERQEPVSSSENAVPRSTRVETVVMGRLDFTSVLLRLVGMELYKIRRRAMSRVLIVLAVLLALLVPLAVGIELAVNQHTPAQYFLPDCQTSSAPDCTAIASIAAASIKQAVLSALSVPLRLPSSLEFATTQNELNPAIILVILLVGSVTGGELSSGTVRLMFTRGPWRGQFLLAKYGATLVCVALGVLLMALSGVLLGQIFNLAGGVPQDWHFLTAAWVGHVTLYLLATMLNWFMYAVVAIFFAFLGSSTVSGIAGALTWFFVEPIVSTILTNAGNLSLGLFGAFMRALPDYLMGNNARALQLNQAHFLFGTPPSSQSNLQALLMLALYLVTFIGLTWWLNERRDVTN